jgi:hypothetical protein
MPHESADESQPATSFINLVINPQPWGAEKISLGNKKDAKLHTLPAGTAINGLTIPGSTADVRAVILAGGYEGEVFAIGVGELVFVRPLADGVAEIPGMNREFYSATGAVVMRVNQSSGDLTHVASIAPGEQAVVGRDPHNEYSSEVAPYRHFGVEYSVDGQVTISDLNTLYGTYVYAPLSSGQ